MRQTAAAGALALLVAACGAQTSPTSPTATHSSDDGQGRVAALSLPAPAAFVPAQAGGDSCPHGAPGGLAAYETGGHSAVVQWNPAPAIHVYELLVERRAVTNAWEAVEGFPHVWQDVRAVQFTPRADGSYRVSVRVWTACGDAGAWSAPFYFSVGGGEDAGVSGGGDHGPGGGGPGDDGGGPTDGGGGPVGGGDGGGGRGGGPGDCPNGGSGDHNDDGHRDCGVPPDGVGRR